VQTKNIQDVGTYKLGLKKGFLELAGCEQTICVNTVNVQYTPSFAGGSVEDQTIAVGGPWSYQLPLFTDYFGDPATIQVGLGDLKDILNFEESARTLSLVVSSAALVGKLGKHSVAVILKDAFGSTKKLSFKVEVTMFVPS